MLLEKMLTALTTAYNQERDGNIGKLFSIFASGLEAIQFNLETVKSWRDLGNANGTTLDRIGKNYGIHRDGADDDYYRLIIQVTIIALHSGGDVDTVISSTATLLELDLPGVELIEDYPAKIILRIDQGGLKARHIANMAKLAVVIKRIIAAGVGLRIVLYMDSTMHPIIHTGMAIRTIHKEIIIM